MSTKSFFFLSTCRLYTAYKENKLRILTPQYDCERFNLLYFINNSISCSFFLLIYIANLCCFLFISNKVATSFSLDGRSQKTNVSTALNNSHHFTHAETNRKRNIRSFLFRMQSCRYFCKSQPMELGTNAFDGKNNRVHDMCFFIHFMCIEIRALRIWMKCWMTLNLQSGWLAGWIKRYSIYTWMD